MLHNYFDLSVRNDVWMAQPRHNLSLAFYIKIEFSEKATNIWKKKSICFDAIEFMSKQVGYFFEILWPSQNVLTLTHTRPFSCIFSVLGMYSNFLPTQL